MDRLDELIQKYFDGQTTCTEERLIRQAFAKGPLPARPERYSPLFSGVRMPTGVHEHAEDRKPSRRRIGLRSPRLRYWAGGIAAGLALCLVLTKLLPGDTAESYVIIDGKRYTDPALVQAKAREALENVSYTDEELSSLLFTLEP